MTELNKFLSEIGISKVKLAKYLGVSRQMIYNYLELDSIDKWPKDKKVLLFNLLGISEASEIKNIDVTTDYISNVELKLNTLCDAKVGNISLGANDLFSNISPENQELFVGVMDLINSKSESEKKLALNQIEGKVSNLIKDLRQKILEVLAQIEVKIDYFFLRLVYLLLQFLFLLLLFYCFLIYLILI